MIFSISQRAHVSRLCLLALAIGITLRFMHLDADPEYYEWVGYLTDEGRWVQYARSLALHGTADRSYVGDLHFFLAPLFQLANYVVFQIAGVSLLTSRVFTAVCGSAMLVLFWLRLRRLVSCHALLLGVAMLAVQSDLVVLSRIAVPEMVVLFLELLIYFVIIEDGKAPWRMAAAGFLMLLASAMKATILFMLPINLAIIYLMPRNSFESGRLRDAGMFLAGFTLPLVMGLFGCYILFSDWTLVWLEFIPKIQLEIEKLLVPSDLFTFISYPFNHSLSFILNLWTLGPWLTTLACWTAGPDERDFAMRRLLMTSGLWLVLYYILMLSLNYFPSRYQLHILIPMALFTTAGVSLMQQVGLRRMLESSAAEKGLRGHIMLAFMSFPTAVLLAPLVAWIGFLLAFDADRLLVKVGCVAFSLSVILYLAQLSKHDQSAAALFVIFPIVEGMVWMASFAFGESGFFWPTWEWQLWIGAFVFKTILGLAVSAFCVLYLRGSPLAEGSRVIAFFAVLYLALFLIKDAAGYLNPRYSMKDTSRTIGEVLAGYTSIATYRAEALFNENRLHYVSTGRRGWTSEPPQILVVAFNDAEATKFFELRYNLIKSYNIYVSSRYFRWHPNLKWNVGEGVVVSVYRRNDN